MSIVHLDTGCNAVPYVTGHLTTICTSALIFAAVLHDPNIQQNIQFLVVCRPEQALKDWRQVASNVEIRTRVTETRKQIGDCSRIIT
jgi:hypothetical protein